MKKDTDKTQKRRLPADVVITVESRYSLTDYGQRELETLFKRFVPDVCFIFECHAQTDPKDNRGGIRAEQLYNLMTRIKSHGDSDNPIYEIWR